MTAIQTELPLPGDPLVILRGDDYALATGAALQAIDPGSTWPANVTAATLQIVRIRDGFVQLSLAGVKISATEWDFYPTAAQTLAMQPGPEFANRYRVIFTLAGPLTHTQIEGLCSIY